MKKGKYQDALEVHRSMLKIQKARRDQVYVKMARCYFQLGVDRKAFDALSDAVDTHFDLQEWLTMKQFINREDNSEQMLKILGKYHKKQPDDIGAALMLTRFLEERGKEEEARKIYQQTLESGAVSGVGPVAELYFSGQLLRLEGKQDEALSTLLGIRDVQTENMPAENYICTLAEEQIKKMKKGEEGSGKPASPSPVSSAAPSPPVPTSTPDADKDEEPAKSPENGSKKEQ
jgi:tetratricopeptide (TPR) repeat protein